MGAGGESAAFRESGKKTRESGGRLLSLVGGGEEKRERNEEIITGGKRSPFYSSEEVAILLLLLLLLGPGKKAQESNFDQTRPLGGGKEGGRKEVEVKENATGENLHQKGFSFSSFCFEKAPEDTASIHAENTSPPPLLSCLSRTSLV